MGKKFCPQCNMNVSVVRRNGKKCCPCCGFDADYMGPAISEQYSSTRPPTQSQTLVKPDSHEESDRTFVDHTVKQNNDAALRFMIIVLIGVSFVLALVATYITEYNWTYEITSDYNGTIFEAFSREGFAMVPLVLTFINVLFAIFIPRYLGIIYFAMGIIYLIPAASVSGDVDYGIYAFLLSLLIGFLIYRWEKSVCGGRMTAKAFYRAFWLKGRF